MAYSIWSHDRLVGHSELDYRRAFPRHRMGDFYPTEAGLKLMPVATGVSPAGIELARMVHASQRADNTQPPVGEQRETLRQTSEFADLLAAENHRDALELELRRTDGSVVPTEWIDIRATEFLLSLAEEDDLKLGDPGSGNDGDVDDEGANGAGAYTGLEPPFSLPDFDDLDEVTSGLDEANEWRARDVFPRYQLQVVLREDSAVP